MCIRLGTWYNTGLGSCGIDNTDSDYIAAMNYIDMANGANPNNNPNCNKKVKIHGESACPYTPLSIKKASVSNFSIVWFMFFFTLGPNGDVTVTVTDTCPTCAKGDIGKWWFIFFLEYRTMAFRLIE